MKTGKNFLKDVVIVLLIGWIGFKFIDYFFVLKNPFPTHQVKSTFKLGLPIYLKGNNNKAILLIHGFTGSTYDFKDLAVRLNEKGYTVYAVRLPGHATDGIDFLSVKAEDWVREVYDKYLDLKAQYNKVYVVGYSMGGTLALYLGSFFDIDRIVLVAPGIKIKDELFEFAPFFALIFSKVKASNFIPSNIPELEYLDREYWQYTWVRPAVELRKLIKVVIRRIDKVKSSVLVIVGDKDQVIDLKGVEEIKRKGSFKSFEVYTVKGGDHFLFIKDKKSEVIDKILEFF